MKLIEQLPSGLASEERIAGKLNLGQRTLQRKLREAGTSYKNILEQTRRELATQYMSSSLLTISEVTYLLGFSETSNFSRAFKRWHGVSPSSYRMARWKYFTVPYPKGIISIALAGGIAVRKSCQSIFH